MRPGFGLAAQDALRQLGHLGLGDAGTQACLDSIGSVQAVEIDPASGVPLGAADPRREGTVIRVGP
jgi:gamma-glutamyltranspeptidase/glutathione hydrolase